MKLVSGIVNAVVIFGFYVPPRAKVIRRRYLRFTCNYVVSIWRGFLFLWVPGMGYVILLWHSLSLPYNYLKSHPKDWRSP